MTTTTASPPPVRGHAALRAGRVSMRGQAHHVTFTTHGRDPLFQAFPAACAAAAALNDPALTPGASVLAWVVMPDHVHCLLRLDEAFPLAAMLRTLKSGSARRINRATGRTGRVWGRAYHDHALRKEEDLRSLARYIVGNPIRAGLARRPADYPFWNAVWL
ncbi:transposase [Luteimonas sp. RD2P54]|uniref:Transposase n=1 Tax=Luteimonas endophytica TaxID=3042023 RepID=A0ABT6J744_9GAMM|nr:transposase [Luteimonas endophytica]MDH5822397.1 transposase [Luteimonas endophytica]